MNNLTATYFKRILKFAFPAKTSRNTLFEKPSFFIKITNLNTRITGIGECTYIEGLSIDKPFLFEKKISEACSNINNNVSEFNYSDSFPGIQFGLETAFNELLNGGNFKVFNNDFHSGKSQIPINGLIWMNNFHEMEKQVIEKIEEGFDCIKIKTGAHDFNSEYAFLKKIRLILGKNIQLRLDANGAFHSSDALEKIKLLSDLDIHSIEQPIKPGQWDAMAELCFKSPVNIALDEELIGCEKQSEMLNHIKPAYIVLKPSLLGGFSDADNWIKLAENEGIKWWATSALESNIGLNAITQWVANKQISLHQGLGTGKIYTNNFDSPLKVENGKIYYCTNIDWNINNFSN